MLEDLTAAASMEFRPKISEIGFNRPGENDPRERKPKDDDPDYARNSRNTMHSTFHKEWDVYREIKNVRDDFSLLTTITAEAYGPDFFSYIRNAQNEEVRRKYMVRTPEG